MASSEDGDEQAQPSDFEHVAVIVADKSSSFHEKDALIDKTATANDVDATAPQEMTSKQRFPWFRLVILGMILFANSVFIWMLFPMLPFMVRFYLPDLPLAKLGYKAGWLGAAFHLGSLFGSLFWGRMADIIGRRPVMLIGMSTTAVACTVLGLVTTFDLALAVRLCWGLLNSVVGVAKTYCGEILDSSMQATGMSIFGIGASLGRLVGPSIGGMLSGDPDDAAPNSHLPLFFTTHPFALPCLIAGALSFVVVPLALCFLEETLPGAKKADLCGWLGRRARGYQSVAASDVVAREGEGEGPFPKLQSSMSRCSNWSDASTAATADTSPDGDGEGDEEADGEPEGADDHVLVDDDDHGHEQGSHSQPILADGGGGGWSWEVWVCVSLYGALAFGQMMATEVYPLWAVLPASSSGFGLDSSTIAVTVIASAPFSLAFQLFCYPKIARTLGCKRTFQVGMSGFAVVCALTPLLAWLPDEGKGQSASGCWSDNVSAWVVLGALVARNGCLEMFQLSAFTSVFVLVNNSCLAKKRGTTNGIGQASAAVCRLVAPPIGGGLFAWSITHGTAWPLNYSLVWYTCSCVGLLASAAVRILPDSIETKKEDRTDRP